MVQATLAVEPCQFAVGAIDARGVLHGADAGVSRIHRRIKRRFVDPGHGYIDRRLECDAGPAAGHQAPRRGGGTKGEG